MTRTRPPQINPSSQLPTSSNFRSNTRAWPESSASSARCLDSASRQPPPRVPQTEPLASKSAMAPAFCGVEPEDQITSAMENERPFSINSRAFLYRALGSMRSRDSAWPF